MSNTWNFPCYTCNDWGNYDSPRGKHGMVWAIGPEVSTLQPFTNTITGIFSFFLRSGWSDVSHTLTQNFTSIGGRAAASWGFLINLTPGVGGSDLNILAYDMTAGTARNQIALGDEDGINPIVADKWYQVAFSMSSSAFTYVVNGSTTPTTNVLSAVNGALNLNYGTDRWWYHCGTSANSSRYTQTNGEQLLITSGWPTFIVGAAAWDTTYLDLSSETVRARIFDSNGNFKNPGENGSLWFGDTYGSHTPAFYFLDGSPRRDNGAYNVSIPQVFVAAAGGGAGSVTFPGGLRKQYESSDAYDPQMMSFNGTDAYYKKTTGITTTVGNVFTAVFRFNVASFTGGSYYHPVMMLGASTGGSRWRLYTAIYSNDHANPANQGRLIIYIQNTAGATLALLASNLVVTDSADHTCFISYNGATGSAIYYIDGVNADDTGYATRVLTAGTMTYGTASQFGVGADAAGNNKVVGKIGYVGYRDAYLTNPTDFHHPTNGIQRIDEIGWTEWGAQPLFWNQWGVMTINKGSSGNMTAEGTLVGPVP